MLGGGGRSEGKDGGVILGGVEANHGLVPEDEGITRRLLGGLISSGAIKKRGTPLKYTKDCQLCGIQSLLRSLNLVNVYVEGTSRVVEERQTDHRGLLDLRV